MLGAMNKIWSLSSVSIVVLGILILATEPYIVNYEPGHFGWVSLHSLAQAKNARPGNFFVGYACEFEDGFKYYFQRHSVLFTVFTKYLLRAAESDSALHLYLSRQLMNIVYVATMGVMLLIAKRFLGADAGAVLAVLLGGAGYLTLRYKNMYDFNQPGLLAFLIFVGILVKYDLSHLDRKRGRFLGSVALLSMIGQSHLIAIGCLVWMILEALMGVSGDNRQRIDWRRNLVLSASALIVSSSTIAVNVAYNASVEARLNNVGLLETGIIGSAEGRLGLLQTHSTFTAMEFVRRQLEGFSINSVPGIFGAFVVDHQDLRPVVTGLAVLAGICFLICALSFLNHVLRGMFSKKYDQSHRERVLLILGVSGPLYLLLMRHWSYYHHFAAVYYLGTYLAFWIFVMGILRTRKAEWQPLLVVAVLFVISVAKVREPNATVTNPINYDELDAYAQFLAERNDQTVYIEGGYTDFIPGSPYAMCYFLSPSKIAESPELADWTLTKQGEHYVLKPQD
jgi:hypothetical protein